MYVGKAYVGWIYLDSGIRHGLGDILKIDDCSNVRKSVHNVAGDEPYQNQTNNVYIRNEGTHQEPESRCRPTLWN
jgi:hypothetical protein